MVSSAEETLASGSGGIEASGGAVTATGPKGILVYQLASARAALKLEINGNGMIPSRAVNARTIIPWLVTQEITTVTPPYTRKRKVQAWNDLNAWMTAHGFPAATLERKPRLNQEGQPDE